MGLVELSALHQHAFPFAEIKLLVLERLQPCMRVAIGEEKEQSFDLDAFAIGQQLLQPIGRSGKQTMGRFLSINSWPKHVIPAMKQNQDKSIILMEG